MREKYESLPLATLKDLAKARGLKGVSGMKKAEVIELMLEEDDPQLDIYPVRRRPSLPRRSGAAEEGNRSAARRFPPSRKNGKRNERDGQNFSPRRDRAGRPNRRRSRFDDGRFE